MAAEAKRPYVAPGNTEDEPPLEAPEADAAEQGAVKGERAAGPSLETGLEVPEADAAEQGAADDEPPALTLETGLEVPEADAVEQALEVPEDEDDYR
ncbi:hypothetical protein NI17_023340 [Thermobifida halotolerans]|uniref:Uncharacterized protein n=1 Tax=Thermobifida halotolerans TaxID=483545 RepID=A0A399FZU0_9ACTN|nr:hypothetical protein [Thermobifida halotolerans]UOE19596.1 hypothetical protein NI17_023340 [Thermobifida halotolerans]